MIISSPNPFEVRIVCTCGHVEQIDNVTRFRAVSAITCLSCRGSDLTIHASTPDMAIQTARLAGDNTWDDL